MPDWHLASIRLTIFVTPDTDVPTTLWREMIGEEPENSNFQRQFALRTQIGPFAEGTLALLIQPMRVDWNHEPVLAPLSGPLPPVLGAFPAAANPFLEFTRRWITTPRFPSATRIALGLVVVSPTTDRETGYRELAQFIDGVPNTPDARDFQYQVNRPRESRAGVDGLQVNRLSKWSVGWGQLVGFRFDGPPSQNNANITLGTSASHLRLELDINTSADFQGCIPRNAIQNVLNDLLAGANEIIEHGNRFV
jgi:hypothetical protein